MTICGIVVEETILGRLIRRLWAALRAVTILGRLIRRLWAALRAVTYRDFWWAEFFSCLALSGWAIVNMENPEALSARNFWPLLVVAQEAFWERMALAIGVMQAMALVANVQWARAFASFCASVLIGSIVLDLIQLGHWPPGAISFYASGFAANLMAMWKNISRHDAGARQ